MGVMKATRFFQLKNVVEGLAIVFHVKSCRSL